MNKSAAFDGPFFLLGDPADAWPAVFFDGGEVLHAIEIGREVFSFILSSFFTDGVSLVDVVNAPDFEVVWTVIGSGKSKDGCDGK